MTVLVPETASAPGVDVVSSISYWTTGTYPTYLYKYIADPYAYPEADSEA